ncbi:MAG: type II toxin-antitoxin system CcdA family antitoxin [Pseudomonadota bacterium]
MNLRIWRKQQNWTVAQVAEWLGIGVSTVTAYENGSRRPRPEMANQIELMTKGRVKAVDLLGVSANVHGSVREDPVPFDNDIREQAKALGLDPDAIADKAVMEAVKRKRIEAWVEENKEAFAAHRKDIEENGLWSDGLRTF